MLADINVFMYRNPSDGGMGVTEQKKSRLAIGEGGKQDECTEGDEGKTQIGSEQNVTVDIGRDCSSVPENQGVETSSGKLSGLVAYCDSSESSDTEE